MKLLLSVLIYESESEDLYSSQSSHWSVNRSWEKSTVMNVINKIIKSSLLVLICESETKDSMIILLINVDSETSTLYGFLKSL